MRKKRLSTGIRNAVTWVKHPIWPVGFVMMTGVFCLTLTLSFPCGRYSHPLSAGVCDSGNSFTSPLEGFLIGVAAGVIVAVLVGMSVPYGSSDTKKLLTLGNGRQPKWRKRWYVPAFLAVYIPLAVAHYIWLGDTGLYWYNYVGRYGILLPLISATLASGLLTTVRRWKKKSKSR